MSIHTALLNRMESVVSFFNFLSLTDCLQLLSLSLSFIAAMFYVFLSYTTIFTLTAPLVLLTTHGFLLSATVYSLLSTSLVQELSGNLNLPSLSLVNPGTPCLPLYFLLLPVT